VQHDLLHTSDDSRGGLTALVGLRGWPDLGETLLRVYAQNVAEDAATEHSAVQTRSAKPLELAWWEFALAIPLVLLVCVFVLARAYVSAAVLLSVTALLFAWRATIAERNIAGGYARARGWLLMTQWTAMAINYAVIVGIFFVANRDHWTHSRQGLVAVYASAGLGFFLAREMSRRGDEAIDFLTGSDSEVKVAALLEPLRAHGWDIVHDVKKDRGGNVDHLVLGPTSAFAIETKSGRDNSRSRSQALSSAAWAKGKYGRPWVNAILCVLTEPPSAPTKVGHAWVTSPETLVPLLERLAGVPLAQQLS
jgi:hypothetical protein